MKEVISKLVDLRLYVGKVCESLERKKEVLERFKEKKGKKTTRELVYEYEGALTDISILSEQVKLFFNLFNDYLFSQKDVENEKS